MKVVIFTCNTGGGHNAAARAIAEELEVRGIDHRVENALSFAPMGEEEIIVGGHALAYKYAPKVYEAGYKYAEEHSSYPMYLNSAKYAPAMMRYLESGGYDTVISVHLSPAHAMTAIRKLWAPNIKQYFVATDYTCSPGVDQVEADRIFIPRGLSREFLLAGVDKAALLETGIPVRRACYEPLTCDYAREQLYGELPLAPADKVVLVGPGCLSAAEVGRLAKAVGADVEAVKLLVLCGKGNDNMKRQLRRLEDPRVKVLGYTTHMDLWMKAADLLITKPGGLTSTEAVSCGVPAILLDVAPGLETHNRDFYVNRGCASSVVGLPALYAESVRLLTDRDARERMRTNQRANFSAISVGELVDEVVRQDAARK